MSADGEVRHVVERVTGIVAERVADGVRLSRVEATIIGPRSISRPHARIATAEPVLPAAVTRR